MAMLYKIQRFSTGGPRPTGGLQRVAMWSVIWHGKIIVLNYLVKFKNKIEVSDLTMKPTTYSRQTSCVSTIHMYTSL